MSAEAPWIALAVDWDESQMWEALPEHGIKKEATDGERLAWICLVCEAKKKGRGGRVSIRKSVFQRAHRLSARSVDGMLHRAQKCGAILISGESITLCGWATYQDKKGGNKSSKSGYSPDFTESAVQTTDHQPQTTDHTSPPTPTPNGVGNKSGGGGGGGGVGFSEAWSRSTETAKAIRKAVFPENQQLSRLARDDLRWIVKVAILADRHGPRWIDPAFEALRSKGIRDPKGLMCKVLNAECEHRGTNLNRELASVRIQDEFLDKITNVKP